MRNKVVYERIAKGLQNRDMNLTGNNAEQNKPLNFDEIDDKAKILKVPNSIGRLPINNYGQLKAAQWQACITVYSPVVLKGLIPAVLASVCLYLHHFKPTYFE